MINRRDVLKSIGVTAIVGSSSGLAFASADTEARFVLVILRGAVDGLALAAPYGDTNYERVRGELAIPGPGPSDGLFKLDGMFGLHPSLPTVHRSFLANEAVIAHAIASPYRERSHFDGQDLLESGASTVGALRDGWLNRALPPLGGRVGHESAIALTQNTPLVLRGSNSATSWAPSQLPDADENTLARLEEIYADDEFFATRLQQALRSQQIAESASTADRRGARGNEAKQFSELMQSAGRFLATPEGPRVAVVELGGWDTHANQGSINGTLANRFAALDTGLLKLQEQLGQTWKRTVVGVVTEFGRTVHVNGTRGTDHGTGTAAVLLGGAVKGGQIVADWPGLTTRDLLAGRDLYPSSDIRSLFKSILIDHLGLQQAFVEAEVFPDSLASKPMENIIRS